MARHSKIFLVPIPTGDNDSSASLAAVIEMRGFSHITNRHIKRIACQNIKSAEAVFTGWHNKRDLFSAIKQAMGNARWSSITSLESIHSTDDVRK